MPSSVLEVPSEADGHGPCHQGASGQVYKQSQPSVQATVRGKDSARRSPVETDTGVPPWAWDIEDSLLGEGGI